MRFVKMHGLGNDYIFIDCLKEPVEMSREQIRQMTDRHTGVGGDGVIFIHPSEKALCRMQMFNPDGSEGQMCGNGMRCIAKYVYEAGYTKSTEFEIETVPGICRQWVWEQEGRITEVTSTLPRPIFDREKIPMAGEGQTVNIPLELADGKALQVTSFALGSPHTVTFVQDVNHYPCEEIGPRIENHPLYPERTNAEFVQVLSDDRVRMRIWERGTGMTLASGSGSTASVVASVLAGHTRRKVTVELPLGEIRVEFPEEGDLLMTGPVAGVFTGDWTPE
jgi:diaminopimelate epimerase